MISVRDNHQRNRKRDLVALSTADYGQASSMSYQNLEKTISRLHRPPYFKDLHGNQDGNSLGSSGCSRGRIVNAQKRHVLTTAVTRKLTSAKIQAASPHPALEPVRLDVISPVEVRLSKA